MFELLLMIFRGQLRQVLKCSYGTIRKTIVSYNSSIILSSFEALVLQIRVEDSVSDSKWILQDCCRMYLVKELEWGNGAGGGGVSQDYLGRANKASVTSII